MAKGTKISTFRHPQMGDQVMRYDRRQRVFFVQVLDSERVTDPDERTCQRKAMERLTEIATYNWRSVIMVMRDETPTRMSFGGRHFQKDNEAGFRFRFERIQIADAPGNSEGRKVQRMHPIDARELLNEEAFTRWEKGLLTEHFTTYEEETELPYSDEAWEGLQHLGSMLELLRDRLNKLIGAEDQTRLLATLSQLAAERPVLQLLPTVTGDFEQKRRKL